MLIFSLQLLYILVDDKALVLAVYDLRPDFGLDLVAKQLLGKNLDAVWLILLLSLMLLFIVVGSISLRLQLIDLRHVCASSHCRRPIPTIFL